VSNETIFSIALAFFLVANPIGNAPAIIALIKDFDFQRQKMILVRESIFSFILAIFFQFFGEAFLGVIHIQDYAVTSTGGLLLFLVSLKMIFSSGQKSSNETIQQEPYIVPIATPLISGPGLLTIIMLYTKQESNNLKIFLSILLAWTAITIILFMSPYMQKILGKRGLGALEQLMGMILSFIAMDMIVRGAGLFMKALEG
jgi:multiple antibiotic resistance protein